MPQELKLPIGTQQRTNPPIDTQEFNIEMDFYGNQNKNSMYKGKEPNKVKNKCNK